MTKDKKTLYQGYYQKDGYGITYTYNNENGEVTNEKEVKREKLRQ